MGKAKKESFDPRMFPLLCHRGLHGEGVTENGLRSFALARQKNLPFELDVHLSKDGHLVVCHDSSLLRTTGKEGIIEELKVSQIKSDYRLLDGEEVPTLVEVLAENDEAVPVVIELKPYKGNQRLLAKCLKNELSLIKDKRKYAIISFDPRALLPLKGLGVNRGLLVGRERTYVLLFRHLFEFLCPEEGLLFDRRVARYRKKGGVLDIWTLQSEEEIASFRDKADILTFQLLPEDTLNRLLQEPNSPDEAN